MLKSNIIGIDLAKNILQICQISKHGELISNKAVNRQKLKETYKPINLWPILLSHYTSAYHFFMNAITNTSSNFIDWLFTRAYYATNRFVN